MYLWREAGHDLLSAGSHFGVGSIVFIVFCVVFGVELKQNWESVLVSYSIPMLAHATRSSALRWRRGHRRCAGEVIGDALARSPAMRGMHVIWSV
jgi:hypothetical protein